MKPLLYVESRQLVNLIRLTLRSPKRLIPALVMTLWVLYFIRGWAYQGSAPMPETLGDLDLSLALRILQTGLFLLLALATLYMIQRSFSESLIIYNLPEIDMLLPTPVSRWRVMAVKLAKLYIRVGLYLCLYIVFLPMLLLIGEQRGGPLLFTPWVVLLLYAVLLINICTVINLMVAHSRAEKWWPRTLVRMLAYGFLVFVGATIWAAYARTGDWGTSVASLLDNSVIMTLMLPAAWAARLVAAPITGWEAGMSWRLAGLGLLAAISFGLVLLRKENPYEPSLAISVRSAGRRKAIKSGDFGKLRAELWRKRAGRPRGISIPPFGRGATAVFWKNMAVMVRNSGGTLLAVVMLILGLAVLGRLLVTDPEALALAQYPIPFIMFYLLWLASFFMQQNLRGELKQANFLKPMPISSWRLMVAETVPAGLLILLLVWHVIVSAVLVFGLPLSRLLLLTAMTLPFVSYGCFCSQVVVAVIYPNWQDVSQQWIAGMLSTALGALAIVPPLAVGALLWYLQVPLLIAVPGVICSSLAIAVGGIALGAAAYNKFDATSE